ncbi:GNAT family N-acetyltransferase [Kushneria phyllosphaerae]|uniref:Ribosomal N-acetyltransferase YdaF n=1 Tax=Kushneria phyllosphaerae TaxID=2100822 RepID=A0A2R8CQ07_9GAMM|nr:GNAT family protein [Kushneria phyllosphaerae]SPJ34965.1 Putative ribosomal N-acetyltransferase YdaF [Kushneria phyllosphaerae]
MTLFISPVQPDDETPFLEAVARSRDLLGDWVNPPSDSERFAQHIARYSADHNVSYLARTGEGQVVGCININNIVRGAFQSGALGYYAFSPYNGRGLMKQAMALVIAEAFGQHQLHRLEANIQPDNLASSALVRSLGFRFEGHSPRYLNIAGQWRDHDRYAITVEEWS